MKVVKTIGFVLLIGMVNPLLGQTEKSEKGSAIVAQQRANDLDSVEISAYENRIVVTNAPIGSVLQIYSVVGIKVKEIEMRSSSGEYPVDIAKGYYIVRIGETVRKVAIR